MKVLILSFSANAVNEDSFIPNKIGLTFSCVEMCEKELNKLGYKNEHICINRKNIRKCIIKIYEKFRKWLEIKNERKETSKN